LVAVGSRSAERAATFANEFGASRAYGGYDDFFADPAVEFVYVATPHPTHEGLVLAAARAGKHVLCEKPMAVNAIQAQRMVDATAASGTFLMEAFAFRCHPQTSRLIEVIRSGEIGELRGVNAAFGYDAGPTPSNYLHRPDLAGGSILDVGCYTVALARQLAGTAVGERFRDPDRVVGAGLLHPTRGIDLDATAILWYADGFAAQLEASIRTSIDSTVEITGTDGTIHLPAPWLPGKHGGAPRFTIFGRGSQAREVAIDAPGPLYAIEADSVVERARAGLREAPELAWTDTIGNMQTLDRWREEVGVRFEVVGESRLVPEAV
jgi:predicted dehydrogenase